MHNYYVLVKGVYEVFWQTAAAQPTYLHSLTWLFNLRPPVPEADALQLELS